MKKRGWMILAGIFVAAALLLLLRWLVRLSNASGAAGVLQSLQGFAPLTLLLFGFLTSFHCIGMCGGLILSQTQTKVGETYPVHATLAYHGARVGANVLVGAVLGALGQALSFNRQILGVVPILCGCVMLVLGLQSLGLLRWVQTLLPKGAACLGRRITERIGGRGPAILGGLTALMPCGMLQIAQAAALATGSWWMGAVYMGCFAVGTVPVLLLISSLGSVSMMPYRTWALRISGAVVLVMSVPLIARGIRLLAG